MFTEKQKKCIFEFFSFKSFFQKHVLFCFFKQTLRPLIVELSSLAQILFSLGVYELPARLTIKIKKTFFILGQNKDALFFCLYFPSLLKYC